MIIALVAGMPGSGKSVVSEIARELGIPIYNMGDVVRAETLRRYGYITPEAMVRTSEDVRKEHGEDYVARKTMERILTNKVSCVALVDGTRSLKEVEYFRKFGEVVIIAVHASPGTRYRRLVERGREGDPKSYEEFLMRDYTELSFGLGSVIALADYMIVNEGPLEQAKEAVRGILRELVRRCG